MKFHFPLPIVVAFFIPPVTYSWASQVVKNPPASAGDAGLTPGLGRSPVVENSDPLQDSLLGNPTDRGGWQATVHGVTESDVTE